MIPDREKRSRMRGREDTLYLIVSRNICGIKLSTQIFRERENYYYSFIRGELQMLIALQYPFTSQLSRNILTTKYWESHLFM